MSELCIKCGESSAVILVGTNGKFCKSCFQYYFSHKFRASLGKNPVVRHGERVAVAFSGGSNSSALLNLLLAELSPNAYKKLKFHPGIIFIDETVVLPDGDYTDNLSAITTIMEGSGLPYNIFRLEEALERQDNQTTANHSPPKTADSAGQLKALFDSLASITCKEELLYRMRCKLLACKARELGYQHIFLGETSTRLAVNILSNIAQGRGARLPLDTQFSDGGSLEGINLLRPLRDITTKEVCVYNAIHKVQTVFLPTLSTKLASNSSIQRLTEDFIVSLSANFPSTETTIYRTSNKLQMNSQKINPQNTNELCHLCGGPQDRALSKGQAMAMDAMNITKILCSGKYDIPEANNTSKNLVSSLDEQHSEDNTDADKISPMCHACTILIDGMRSADVPSESDIQQTFSKLLMPSDYGLDMTEDELKRKMGNVIVSR